LRFAWKESGARDFRRRRQWHAFQSLAASLGRPMRLGKHIGAMILSVSEVQPSGAGRVGGGLSPGASARFVASLFEFAQKSGQHGGRLLFRVVQQQNPAFSPGRSARGSKRVPSRASYRPSPNPRNRRRKPQYSGPIERLRARVSAKARKPEKRHLRGAAHCAIGGPVILFESLMISSCAAFSLIWRKVLAGCENV